MSETTGIQWTDHTGGPYLGCSCVSPGCTFCYAMALALTRPERIFRTAYKRAEFADWETRPVWGDKATRVLSKGFWNDARRINANHAKEGTRGRWFPSMIDWLDKMPGGIIDQDGKPLDPIEVRSNFLKLIYETPNLDWLLLTKRPENFFEHIGEVYMHEVHTGPNSGQSFRLWLAGWESELAPPDNVWIGASCEDQQRANERVPHLLKIPAIIRFLSLEPLLGPINLRTIILEEGVYVRKGIDCLNDSDWIENASSNGQWGSRRTWKIGGCETYKVDWIICGGESGQGARPCNIEWIRDIVNQCRGVSISCFVKQLGGFAAQDLSYSIPEADITNPELDPADIASWEFHRHHARMHLKHSKGGDPEEWPEDLKVRCFPRP